MGRMTQVALEMRLTEHTMALKMRECGFFNHGFWGYPIFTQTHIYIYIYIGTFQTTYIPTDTLEGT